MQKKAESNELSSRCEGEKRGGAPYTRKKWRDPEEKNSWSVTKGDWQG